jgi:hypothetical protein
METLEEANAIGSLFVANRRRHSRQREGWFCAAPSEPTLQCAKRPIMLVTKFAPPQSTGFEFPHQSFGLLAASPFPNTYLSDFRHADTKSKTRPAR